jgi:hypothetical protein
MSFEQMADTLKGRVIKSIKGLEGLDSIEGNDTVIITFTDGVKLQLYHSQDCCECVYVEDVIGDINDLIGQPLIELQEETNTKSHPIDFDPNQISDDESFTWTFYKIASPKGWVVIRWYGSSNGYYSEYVDYRVIDAKGERYDV